MGWTSPLGVVLLVVVSVRCDNTTTDVCGSNDECFPYGCCLAAFVNDENPKCQLLGDSGDLCDTTLSVSVLEAEGEEFDAKNKYLGHCPCREGLVCTKEDNVGHCASHDP